MYKVKEAADQLGVSRVEIFEILLSQRDLFEPYVRKENSITYISEEGLLLLKSRIQSVGEVKAAPLAPIEIEENVVEEIKNISLEPLDISDGLSDWLREIHDDGLLSDQYDHKLREIRNQITGIRNKILNLDSEIKMKDDAIRHYHEIMKDDIRWLEDLDRKMQLLVKHRFLENAASESTVDLVDDKGNFLKFFKR